MKIQKIVLSVLFACLVGCDAKESLTQALKLESDEEKLLIFEKIPHGITYQKLQLLVPEITKQVAISETMTKHEQFEAYWHTTLFGRTAKIQFNIIRDTLHTYYFWLDNMDSTAGWNIYNSLQQFYKKQYGTFKTEHEDWEGHVRNSSFWPDDKKAFGITLGIYGERHLLGWGY